MRRATGLPNVDFPGSEEVSNGLRWMCVEFARDTNNSIVGVGKRDAYLLVHGDLPKAALVRNYLEVYWPCAGGLSAVNAIGTQLCVPINSGLTRWRMAVLNNK